MEGETKSRRFLRAAGVLCATAALFLIAGCAAPNGTVQTKDDEEVVATYSQVVPAGAFDELRLTHNLGEVEIIGTSDKDIAFEVTKRAKSKDREAATRFLEEIKSEVAVQGNRVAVLTKEAVPQPGVRLTSLKYVLKIPAAKRVKVDLLGTNTDFRITDITGSLYAKMSFGAIRIRGLVGDISIKGTNTRVQVADSDGALDIDNSNGPVEIDGASLQMRAKVATSNAELSVKLKSIGVGQYEFLTTNAPARVYIPYGAGVRIQAATTNGRIFDQLPMTWTDRNGVDDQNVQHLDGWINAGGAQLTVSTVNSDVTLGYR